MCYQQHFNAIFPFIAFWSWKIFCSKIQKLKFLVFFRYVWNLHLNHSYIDMWTFCLYVVNCKFIFWSEEQFMLCLYSTILFFISLDRLHCFCLMIDNAQVIGIWKVYHFFIIFTQFYCLFNTRVVIQRIWWLVIYGADLVRCRCLAFL